MISTKKNTYVAFGHGPGIHALQEFIDLPTNVSDRKRKTTNNLNLHLPKHGPCVDCHMSGSFNSQPQKNSCVNLIENNYEELICLKLYHLPTCVD